MTKIEEYLSKKDEYMEASRWLRYYGTVGNSTSTFKKITIKVKDNSVELFLDYFGEIEKEFFIKRLSYELKNIAMKTAEDIDKALNMLKAEAKEEIEEILEIKENE